jgi:hypothetical protein
VPETTTSDGAAALCVERAATGRTPASVGFTKLEPEPRTVQVHVPGRSLRNAGRLVSAWAIERTVYLSRNELRQRISKGYQFIVTDLSGVSRESS